MQEDLPSSRLGTLEYWQTVYDREVSNYASDADRGEVWFGLEAANVMLDYLYRHYASQSTASSSSLSSSSSSSLSSGPTVLDLGTGNGQLLFRLCGIKDDDDDDDEDDSDDDDDADDNGDNYNEGRTRRRPFTASSNLCGTDYSSSSLQLCRDIALAKSADVHSSPDLDPSKIRWLQCNLLEEAEARKVREAADGKGDSGWDILLDKGTLDAIALTPATDSPLSVSATKTPLDLYLSSLLLLTHSGSLFLITSCNFTAEELIGRITNATPFTSSGHIDQQQEARFRHVETLPPKKEFSFGGVKGSTTCCVAFRRR